MNFRNFGPEHNFGAKSILSDGLCCTGGCVQQPSDFWVLQRQWRGRADEEACDLCAQSTPPVAQMWIATRPVSKLVDLVSHPSVVHTCCEIYSIVVLLCTFCWRVVLWFIAWSNTTAQECLILVLSVIKDPRILLGILNPKLSFAAYMSLGVIVRNPSAMGCPRKMIPFPTVIYGIIAMLAGVSQAAVCDDFSSGECDFSAESVPAAEVQIELHDNITSCKR